MASERDLHMMPDGNISSNSNFLSFIELSTEKSPSPNGEPDMPMLIKTSSSASLNRRMVVGAPDAHHFCVPRAERRCMISTTIVKQLPALYAAKIYR